MIEKSVMDRYIEESTLKMNECSKRQIEVFLTKFFSFKEDVEYNDLTKQDLIDMFSELTLMSANSFYTYKSKINDFMKWMKEQGYGSEQVLKNLSDVQFTDINRSGFYNTYYFRDYDDLFNTIDVVFKQRGTEFDTFKSAALLVWFGIDIKDVPQILKNDLDEDEGTIIHPGTKEKIKLPANAVYLLARYRDAQTYDSRKFGGRALTYVDSQYLFRSYKNAYFTTKQINYFSISANNVAEEFGKIFQWNKIYLSGIYNRIYEYELQHGNIGRTNYDVLKTFFVGDDKMTKQRKTDLSRKYEEYQEFKEYMYF